MPGKQGNDKRVVLLSGAPLDLSEVEADLESDDHDLDAATTPQPVMTAMPAQQMEGPAVGPRCGPVAGAEPEEREVGSTAPQSPVMTTTPTPVRTKTPAQPVSTLVSCVPQIPQGGKAPLELARGSNKPNVSVPRPPRVHWPS